VWAGWCKLMEMIEAAEILTSIQQTADL